MAKLVCKIFGVLFIAIGLLVMIRRADVDMYHNFLHLGTGIIAAWLGFAGSRSAAKNFCLAFGAFYLLFGLSGIVAGDPSLDRLWHVGPLHLNTGDHIFHIVLGSIFLVSGFLTTASSQHPLRSA